MKNKILILGFIFIILGLCLINFVSAEISNININCGNINFCFNNDINQDGKVDNVDLEIVERNMNEICYLLGDMNIDEKVNNNDISPFVTALVNPVGYEQQYGITGSVVGDINLDGNLNNNDVYGFIGMLISGNKKNTCENADVDENGVVDNYDFDLVNLSFDDNCFREGCEASWQSEELENEEYFEGKISNSIEDLIYFISFNNHVLFESSDLSGGYLFEVWKSNSFDEIFEKGFVI